ncbi:hypothetical protein IAU60_005021 [Kwoniella sp. DSM 27419]
MTARPASTPQLQSHPALPSRQVHPAAASGLAVGPPLTRSRSTAHLPLYRRILFPLDDPAATVLPLVDGSDKAVAEINERLHHLIALVLRAYVLSWYRFTSSRTLPSQIHRDILRPTLRPILNGIYQNPDRLGQWILLDLPTVLQLHIKTYWEARAAARLPFSSSATADSEGPRVDPLASAYHARLPLLSVVSEGDTYTLSPLYLATLTSAILSDGVGAQPDVQRLMAREVLARSVLGSVGRRCSQPWFWSFLTLKLLGEPGSKGVHGMKSSSFEQETDKHKASTKWNTGSSIYQVALCWTAKAWSILILLWTTATNLVTIYSSSSPRTGYAWCWQPALALCEEISGVNGRAGQVRPSWSVRIVWAAVEMVLGLTGRMLDRLLPHMLHTHVLTPRTSLKLIDMLEHVLFPQDGWPGPTPPDPTPDEAASLRRRAEMRLTELVPAPLSSLIRSSPKDTLLDPLDNEGCNAHLVAMVLDSLVGALIPDLVIDSGGETPINWEANASGDADEGSSL